MYRTLLMLDPISDCSMISGRQWNYASLVPQCHSVELQTGWLFWQKAVIYFPVCLTNLTDWDLLRLYDAKFQTMGATYSLFITKYWPLEHLRNYFPIVVLFHASH